MRIRFLICFILILIYSCKQKTIVSDNHLFNNYYQHYTQNRNTSIDSLMYYTKIVDSITNTINNDKFNWLSNKIKGSIFLKVGEYDRANKFYYKANKAIIDNVNCDTLLAKTYINIGFCFNEIGNYSESVSNYLKALSIYEKLNLTNSVNETYIYLAELYQTKGDITSAKKTLKKIIEYKGSSNKLKALHTLANVYGEQGLIDSALYIDNNAIRNCIVAKKPLLLSSFYNNKALCYIELKLLDSALIYLEKSYEIDSLNYNIKNMAANLSAIGQVNYNRNSFPAALNNYTKALALLKKGKLKRNLAFVYKDISEFYKKQNNWKVAYLYNDSAEVLRREINSLEQNTKFETLQLDFETQKKDNIINEQTQKLNVQKTLLIIIIVIILLISVVLVLLQKYFKSKRDLTNMQLINDAVFESEQKERERIARDLHDSVGQKLSVVKMQLSMKNLNIKSASLLLDEGIQEVRTISHNLIPYDLNKGLLNAINELVEQINHTSLTTKITLRTKGSLSKIIFEKRVELIVYRMLQEAVNNALKYAKAPTILIWIDCSQNQLLLNLKDNGIGFDTSLVKNGIGLSNILERVNQINGTVKIISSIGNGTEINIVVPL